MMRTETDRGASPTLLTVSSKARILKGVYLVYMFTQVVCKRKLPLYKQHRGLNVPCILQSLAEVDYSCILGIYLKKTYFGWDAPLFLVVSYTYNVYMYCITILNNA